MLNNFLNNKIFAKKKKNNIILGNYIKKYISTDIFIEIKWIVDFRKDPNNFFNIDLSKKWISYSDSMGKNTSK